MKPVEMRLAAVRVSKDRRKKGDVGRNAADAELAQCAESLLYRVAPLAAGGVYDHFRKQRVERRAGPVAGIAEGIDAHARPGRQVEDRERPAGRLGRAGLVHGFHVDAELDGVPPRLRHIGLGEAERTQRSAGGDRELRPHQVDAEHLLGDGVLDLQPRIGLDESEAVGIPVGLVIDQKLESAEIVVLRRRGKLLGGLDDAGAQCLAQRGAGRHLDEFLVAPLDGAFALPEMADCTVPVADDLHLDMACFPDQPFQINIAAAEGGHRLGLAAGIGFLQSGGIVDGPHAAAAAAGDRLDHDRAVRGQKGARLLQRGCAFGAVDDRHAAALGQRLGLGLVAEQFQRGRRRPDKGDAFLGAALGQCDVLAEETVAGMQRIATGRLCRRNDGLDIEIGPGAPARNLVALVSRAHMQRSGIVGRINRDAGKIRLPRSARDANGDLAAIGDQKFLERHRQVRLSDPSSWD